MKKHAEKRAGITIGPQAQKLLLLLQTGITLSLTSRPDSFFRVIRETSKELKKINQRTLQRAIRALYRSKLIGCEEHDDGTITLTLSENGEKRALRYHLGNLCIKKPAQWDSWWRVVVFDVPERLRLGREALVDKLKQLGFSPIQKSVFVFPYECKNELDFIIEAFDLRPYVRLMRVKEIDIELELKEKFGLV
ncbi:hypothetical protein HY250_02865 [Candidatus Azambacteria bacterium]|nr:hypothetical protein [Candidatus Azambacteria bacterium]MBI3685320.1 hypothetical protein [Candidatus Azambacteria bacterium]